MSSKRQTFAELAVGVVFRFLEPSEQTRSEGDTFKKTATRKFCRFHGFDDLSPDPGGQFILAPYSGGAFVEEILVDRRRMVTSPLANVAGEIASLADDLILNERPGHVCYVSKATAGRFLRTLLTRASATSAVVMAGGSPGRTFGGLAVGDRFSFPPTPRDPASRQMVKVDAGGYVPADIPRSEWSLGADTECGVVKIDRLSDRLAQLPSSLRATEIPAADMADETVTLDPADTDPAGTAYVGELDGGSR